MKILFIAWDGPDQSYLESLFLPIYARLREYGMQFHVLQFSWADEAAGARTARAAAALGIDYERASIARRPKVLATASTVARGAWLVRRYARARSIDVLMPRSTLPALMTLIAARQLRASIVYDADGFMPDERVEFAGWSSSGLMYRGLRDVESEMLRRADGVVTRTAKAREILLARAGATMQRDKIHVIPNAKDPDSFQPFDAAGRSSVRRELGVPEGAPLLVYAGSLGPQYYPEQMFEFLHLVRQRRRDAQLVLLTGQEAAARQMLERSPVDRAAVQIRRVSASDVPRFLAAADLGLALRRPTFSQLGVSPIKVAEYLLCGVPVLASRGVGDLDEQLTGDVAHLVAEPTGPELSMAADWFVGEVVSGRESLRAKSRGRGVDLFGINQAVSSYARVLSEAAKRNKL